MEVHAWFNPYRAVQDTSKPVANNHVSKVHPEWLLAYRSLRILDPGKHEVREYITQVIMDVVRRYDIDGMHFDDYFYPYSGTTNEDAATFTNPLYNRGFTNIADWRRDNVNLFVKMVSDSVRTVKPRVKFGISPFGIWRNLPNEGGSATSGLQAYDVIYADSRKWLRERWVDYLAPQVYWNIGYSTADYGVLIPWWNTAFSNERHLYIGQATFRVHPTDSNWPVQEIIRQVLFNRDYLSVYGSIHFSAKYFRDNTKLLRVSLRLTVYSTPALVPLMNWEGKGIVPPNRPENIMVTPLSNFFFFTWSEPAAASDGDKPTQYIVYRFATFPVDVTDPRNIVQMGSSRSYIDSYPTTGNYAYTVTALDRNHNESERSSTVIVSSTGNVVVGVQEPVAVPLAFEL